MAQLPVVPVNPQEARPASIRSGSTRQWTPERYTASLSAYAKQRNASLYAGVHLTRIAGILRRPYESPGRHSLTYKPTLSSDFATLYRFTADGGKQILQLTATDQLLRHSEGEANNILFLRGQPCPEWLVLVGTTYDVDPEFFSRHLDFLSNLSSRRYFAQPSLVSTSRNVLQFSYVTIGEFHDLYSIGDQVHLDRLRHSTMQDMTEYFNDLGKRISRNLSRSESMVRAYHVLDRKHFAIEQQASICLQQTDNGWTLVVWLDTGRPLTADQPGPWKNATEYNQRTGHETFLPWIQLHPFASLTLKLALSQGLCPEKEVEQTASLLHLDYGKTLDRQGLMHDPLYALHELLTSFAYSEVQFLNVIESKINEDIAKQFALDHNSSPANLEYFQGLLDKHAEMLRRNITAVKSRSEAGWPQPTEVEIAHRTAAQVRVLLQDYEGLLMRTETLSRTCRSRLHILMSRAGILESNKAIEQAKVVTKLTRLAFVFVPLSFVSSFFGMNLTPLIDPPGHSLWLFFAVSAPMVVVLFISITWRFEQVVELFEKCRTRQEPASPSKLEGYD